MDSSDIDSNCSNVSDSLQSNLSGLSCYEQEYQELKALVKPPGGHSSPNHYQKLFKSHSMLVIQLENAHNQIEGLLKGRDNVALERQVYELGLQCSALQNVRQDNQHAADECLTLNIKLQECVVDNKVNLGTIEALKHKIALQHIEGLGYLKQVEELQTNVDTFIIKQAQWEKSRKWYQNEIEKWQKNCESISELNVQLNGQNLSQKLELGECQGQLNKRQIEHLKETQALIKKLDNLNNKIACDSINSVPNVSSNNTMEEVDALKKRLSERDENIFKLTQENAKILSQCIMLQQSLKQAELDKEICEDSLKELQKSHEGLKASNRDFLTEIGQLKSDILAKAVELKTGNVEKIEVERSVQVLRQQFMVFKEKYEEVKKELTNKNKEILKLTKENQENFMNKNWTICELKNKDEVIEKLKLSQNYKTRKTLDITDDEKFETFKTQKNQVEKIIDQLNIGEFQSEVDIRLKYLASKLDRAEKKCDCLRSNYVHKISGLEVLLQVKKRKFEDKRKKMDQNYSLLLRKVKEHMRGRSLAEKKLKSFEEINKKRIFLLEKQIRTLVNDRDFFRRLTNDLKTTLNLQQVHSKTQLSEPDVLKLLQASHSIAPVRETLQGCIEGLRADILGLRGKVLEKYVSS